jgi:formamidopyrimidine-DNA glycosylase
MPELPEVETVRRGLLPVLEGRRIASVRLYRADLRIPFPEGFAERLSGRRVERLARRGKYILAHCDDGTVLIVHLGMSGRLTIDGTAERHAPDDPHTHVILETDAGVRLVLRDHRRFGLMTLCSEVALGEHPLLRHLGFEPLSGDFTPGALAARLAGRRTSIKAALIDQRLIAGLGNIYACEALYRARLSPRRRAGGLKAGEVSRLVRAIRAVLKDAIAAGGSSLRDYVSAAGQAGYFQHRFCVYDQEGAVCATEGCGAKIRRFVQAGRSTFYCPRCQR